MRTFDNVGVGLGLTIARDVALSRRRRMWPLAPSAAGRLAASW